MMREQAQPGLHVLIVEDDQRLARCWQAALRRHRHDVELAETSRDAEARVRAVGATGARFDVVLVDLVLADGPADDLLSFLHQAAAAPVVAVISGHLDAERVTGLFQDHTVAVPKPISGEQLVRMVELLMRGSGYLAAVDAFAAQHRLSPRERAVLLGAVEDKNRKEVAHALGCSQDTVRTYWERIKRKTGLRGQHVILATLFRQLAAQQWR